jgi:hypothetical protein
LRYEQLGRADHWTSRWQLGTGGPLDIERTRHQENSGTRGANAIADQTKKLGTGPWKRTEAGASVVRKSLASRLQTLLRRLRVNWRVRRHSVPWSRIRRQRLQVPNKGASRFSVFVASEVVLATFDPGGCERVVAQHGVERLVESRQVPLDDVGRAAGGESSGVHHLGCRQRVVRLACCAARPSVEVKFIR